MTDRTYQIGEMALRELLVKLTEMSLGLSIVSAMQPSSGSLHAMLRDWAELTTKAHQTLASLSESATEGTERGADDLIRRLREAHADWLAMDEGLECGGAALMREAATALEAAERAQEARVEDAERRCERVAVGLESALSFPSRLLLDTAVRASIAELRTEGVRCRFCLREMNVSANAFAESPFCDACLRDRIARVAQKDIEWRAVGSYAQGEGAAITDGARLVDTTPTGDTQPLRDMVCSLRKRIAELETCNADLRAYADAKDAELRRAYMLAAENAQEAATVSAPEPECVLERYEGRCLTHDELTDHVECTGPRCPVSGKIVRKEETEEAWRARTAREEAQEAPAQYEGIWRAAHEIAAKADALPDWKKNDRGALEAERGAPPAPQPSEVERTILYRWCTSGLPSVDSFDHAVDVANANYRRAEKAEADAERATAELVKAHERGDRWSLLAQQLDAQILKNNATVCSCCSPKLTSSLVPSDAPWPNGCTPEQVAGVFKAVVVANIMEGARPPAPDCQQVEDASKGCGGSGFVMADIGPNRVGECCPGCQDCEPPAPDASPDPGPWHAPKFPSLKEPEAAASPKGAQPSQEKD